MKCEQDISVSIVTGNELEFGDLHKWNLGLAELRGLQVQKHSNKRYLQGSEYFQIETD
jgi:hypothetical protein